MTRLHFDVKLSNNCSELIWTMLHFRLHKKITVGGPGVLYALVYHFEEYPAAAPCFKVCQGMNISTIMFCRFMTSTLDLPCATKAQWVEMNDFTNRLDFQVSSYWKCTQSLHLFWRPINSMRAQFTTLLMPFLVNTHALVS